MDRNPVSRQIASLLAAEPDPDRPLLVLGQADGLLAVAKPVGLASDATVDPRRDSVRAAAFRWLRERESEAEPPVLVHRLDGPTSGVMLLARTGDVAAQAQRAFAERGVEKIYLARVAGRPPHTAWEVRDHLRAPRRVGPGHPVERVRSGGQLAHTRFHVLRAEDAESLVEARPHASDPRPPRPGRPPDSGGRDLRRAALAPVGAARLAHLAGARGRDTDVDGASPSRAGSGRVAGRPALPRCLRGRFGASFVGGVAGRAGGARSLRRRELERPVGGSSARLAPES